MATDHANQLFTQIKKYYDEIPLPKYRNAELDILKEKIDLLQGLKDDLGHEKAYKDLLNAMSQIASNLEKASRLISIPTDQIWKNFSERAMNKAIPAILKRSGISWPVEYTDKWGNASKVSNGYWEAKNYRVMDSLGYMFLWKIGGDRLPKNTSPLFNDLHDIQKLEKHLNGDPSEALLSCGHHCIRFTDEQFRQFSGFQMSSAQIKNLLLETSRVEFKLTFPVRLKATGAKENTHRMNYYSRFFEMGYEDLNVKSNGVVLSRRYSINFNTLLGKLFVNNLLAKFNDQIDRLFYLLPDSAQIFYRRGLSHHNKKRIPFNISTIADYTGLTDRNPWNLITTIEKNILTPLMEYGYIDSYEKVGDDPKAPKYILHRTYTNSTGKLREEGGSVKNVVGSVKDQVGSVKK